MIIGVWSYYPILFDTKQLDLNQHMRDNQDSN